MVVRAGRLITVVVAVIGVQAKAQPAATGRSPAVAVFNECAIHYNNGETDDALRACDRALAIDPNFADAWFIKGSVMVGNGTVDKSGKATFPPGTVDALRRYVALKPDGSHIADVKQMLDFVLQQK